MTEFDEPINWEDRLKKMLQIIGTPAKCKACDLPIYWVATRRDAWLPYTANGEPHFSDCPEADKLRKPRRK